VQPLTAQPVTNGPTLVINGSVRFAPHRTLAHCPTFPLSPPVRSTPRLLLALLLVSPALRAHEVAGDMLAAANAFLGALSPDQKKQATYPLTDK